MLTFLGVAFLIYGGMHLYAFSKVWLVFPHSWGLGLTLVLGGIVMTLSPLFLWYMTKQNWHGAAVVSTWVIYTWMGFLFLFFCISLAFDLGRVLVALLGYKWLLNDSIAFRTVGLFALAMLGYGFVEARQIQVEKITITTPKLASGRVTIAQVSDMHLGMMLGDKFLERAIAKLREIQPDIVVATGDIVEGQGDDLDGLAKRFSAYKASRGAYAIIGNHEYYAGLENSLRFLRGAGFTVLRGESVSTAGITFVGIDDPARGALGHEATVNSRKTLAPISRDNFIILLKHQPVIDSEIPFDLQLSGHIHGGQIFPFGYLTRLTYGVHTGLTQLADGRKLYVSRGTGTWGPPIRIFAPPEITLITIGSEHNHPPQIPADRLGGKQ